MTTANGRADPSDRSPDQKTCSGHKRDDNCASASPFHRGARRTDELIYPSLCIAGRDPGPSSNDSPEVGSIIGAQPISS